MKMNAILLKKFLIKDNDDKMFLYVGLLLFIYIYHFIIYKFSDNYLEDAPPQLQL